MKTAVVLLLALSLALNATLVVMFIAGSHPPPTPVRSVAPLATPPAQPALAPEVWRSFETADQPDLVARLRAAAFPTEVIRAILQARFEEELAARSKLLNPDANRQPFWKNTDPQVQATLSKLRREHQRAMRALLGEDPDSNQLINQVLPGRRVDGLPPEKAAAVLEVVREFEDRRAEFSADPLSPFNPEKRAALNRELRDALARLLTPQELEEYDLRNSTVAMSMRIQLAAFEPSEDEFRAIFRLRQASENQYGSSFTASATAEQARLRSEGTRLLSEQIRAALGPVRGEEYARKADSAYVQTNKVVERLELPRETTDQVYAVQRDITTRARSVTTDRSVTEESRTRQLTALREEAIGRLTPLLGGSRGLEIYRQYGGPWLDALQLRPTGTPPPTMSPRP